ncbi:peptidyl-prolyl cis-trans isomerase FKBP8 [Sitodiplosis mosellana]|uniref:peptidyl-prolyl cis-trans isomerase FKBP8 n=1 Tax=Sitodiplosis mosellana TaxID=263140 RepID=UPI002443DCBD|nr:peptidyl-prolyl cis-trans isomerase FKBP8 [Sitodiplosis mosellana]XP_055315492.1 peptidyl-prolyl cis-trans isomerase FKBP8 [Sitodiplosis mosellana]XP_055315493.1 peptidyl-prolyl cis-trans isomerase FKBP8 [Sitodiplosis mosellana]XP_055315494.1 peptidyl-prolyl cis-trans isomerase FKBP8 [Sitodiplosis mosellana]
MDRDSQIDTNPIESSNASNEIKDENTKPENSESSEQSNIIDVIGNGQLVKKTIRAGEEGFQPQRGNICKINLVGKLEDGTVVEEFKDYAVQVGDVEVVQGVDMSLPLMTVGELAEISADPRFAYGSQGLTNENDNSKSIPPNAKVIYTAELLECNDEEDLENVPYASRQSIGNHKRERGNFWYDRGEYNMAIQLYRRSLEYLDDTDKYVGDNSKLEEFTNDQLQELLETRVKVYNNLAAAQMKISAFDVALTSVDNVLRCQPENVKALFRKGKILEAKGDIKAAIPILQKAAILDPDSRAIQQLLSKCIMKSRREARNEKDMYQKMFNQTQKLESKGKRSKTGGEHEMPKFKLWGYLGSILIVVAGVAIYRSI